MTNYHEILGVGRDADQQTIKRAYRRLAKQCHPDVCKDADAARRFGLIREAYEALSGRLPPRPRRWIVRPRGNVMAAGDVGSQRQRPPAGQVQGAANDGPMPFERWHTPPGPWTRRLQFAVLALLLAVAVAFVAFELMIGGSADGPPQASPSPSPPRSTALLPPPTLEEVENVRRRAERARARIRRLPREAAIAGELDRMEAAFQAGEQQRARGIRSRAIQRYLACIEQCQRIERAQADRCRHVLRRREEASRALRRAAGAEPGRGIDERLADARLALRRADEHLAGGAYAAAARQYALLLEKCEAIRAFDAARQGSRKTAAELAAALFHGEAFELRPFAPDAWRAAVAAAGDARRALDRGRTERARAACAFARDLVAEIERRAEVDLRCWLARGLLAAGRDGDALAEVQAALKAAPGDVEAAWLQQALRKRLFLTLDCGGGATMKLRKIPPGTFRMGSPPGEGGQANERPQRRVTLTRPFYMQVTEVTQAQWTAVMGTAPWKAGERWKSGGRYPATHIRWPQAAVFCRKLSARTVRTVRLPTEAEWEYACRAGTRGPFSFDNARDIHRYANYLDWWAAEAGGVGHFGDGGDGYHWIAPVGSYKPNPWGLHDMHGNVCEWCSDWWNESHYARASLVDPKGPRDGTCRVRRGGSWSHGTWFSRSAARISVSKSDSTGFRVAVEIEAPKPAKHR